MSSDSSDDEILNKLREATDLQFINDEMFKKHETKSSKKQQQIEKQPSLRRSKDEDEQFNLFRVSPEFRGYVAKHLSAMLDNVLNQKLRHKTDDNYKKPKRRKGGIKLLKNSSNFIKIESKEVVQKPPKKNYETDDDDDEKFKSVAVNPDDILGQKDTKHWSNRSKAPVYTYTKSNHGLILK